MALLGLSFALLVACPGDEYSLAQTHVGDDLAWSAHFEGFRNLCLQSLCPDGDDDCLEDGTDDIFDLDVETMAHARDRFAFFMACESCSGADELIDEGETEFMISGPYAIHEGRGRIRLRSPPLTPHHGPNVPTGYARRYERGACSYEVALSQSGLLERLGVELVVTLENMDSFLHFGSFHVGIVSQEGRVLLGSEDCDREGAYNRDFISLSYQLGADPLWGLGHFFLSLDIRFRLVSRERWEFLACTGTSCSEEERATTCAQDGDCAHLPGAVCTEGLLQGQRVCANPNALDVVEYQLVVTPLEDNCRDYSCRWRRRAMFRELAETSADSLRQIFAPLVNTIVEDYFWTDVPAAYREVETCADDSDCDELLIYGFLDPLSNYDLLGRCGEGGVCQVSPIHIYGVNTYPDSLELVLSKESDDDLSILLGLLDNDEDDDDYCTRFSSMTRRESGLWF